MPLTAPSQVNVHPQLAFDACQAPSLALLRRFSPSPFHAIGVYIGGRNRECSQPTLTASYVRAATLLGWALIPTYVGLQAPYSFCGGCATITPRVARAQGAAAAADAIGEAHALRIHAGNPIYFDMEAYQRGYISTPAVLAFLEGWTDELHSAGYVSGVYASLNSGIADLVSQYRTGYVEPDDIWFAHWNGMAGSGDAAIPASYWAVHRRIHQYVGGVDISRNGASVNVDADWADGAVVSAASLAATGR